MVRKKKPAAKQPENPNMLGQPEFWEKQAQAAEEASREYFAAGHVGEHFKESP